MLKEEIDKGAESQRHREMPLVVEKPRFEIATGLEVPLWTIVTLAQRTLIWTICFSSVASIIAQLQ